MGTTYETYKAYLNELGAAMFALLTGKDMHPDQISLIKGASAEQKVLAMELVAGSSLKGKEYTTYCRNKRRIMNG